MKNNFNYENNILKIEQILETMNEGEMPLDKSMELFGKGIELINSCNAYLEKAEKKISLLQGTVQVDWSEEDEED